MTTLKTLAAALLMAGATFAAPAHAGTVYGIAACVPNLAQQCNLVWTLDRPTDTLELCNRAVKRFQDGAGVAADPGWQTTYHCVQRTTPDWTPAVDP
jgi:hypothetical protein